VRVVRAFPNLQPFLRPVQVTHAPDGTDRIFVVSRAGFVDVFPNDPGVTPAQVARFLDVSTLVYPWFEEMGLLGLAFDPAYAQNGYFYVNYTAGPPDRTVVARYRVDPADPNRADPASERILLTFPQPFQNHNGGMLAFGPDRMLYIAVGDGGEPGDPQARAQDLTNIYGGILRIDPHGSTAGLPYGIPGDNPFVGIPGARGERWAAGLRNPWRFSFDRNTGELWCGDVGERAREEIDLIRRGGNYGWPRFEGNLPFNNPQNVPASSFDAPLVDLDFATTPTVIGGYVYRGSRVPALRGAYLYGSFNGDQILALTRDAQGQVVTNAAIAAFSSPSSFGEDAHGEVLVVSYAGTLHRFEPANPQAPPFPTRLSQTGIFANLATLEAVPGLYPYAVHAELWSDGAEKRRWLSIPSYDSVTFHPTDAWSFPVGTVLVKHFGLRLDVTDPESVRRLETRVLVHETEGWAGYTYRWDDAQQDALLLADRLDETFTIRDPAAPGGVRAQTWTYPSRPDCLRCHTAAAGRVLGLRTEQLAPDRFAQASGERRSWLHTLAHGHVFTAPIGDPAQYAALTDPHRASAPLAPRARAYLAANCAGCHRPLGPTRSPLDLRAAVSDAQMNAVGVRPLFGGLGLPDPWLIKRQDHVNSVLWERLRRTDGHRMPPLGTAVPDARAIALLGGWIDGL
jgi:uncharacterized repeat protein (TIGR03806 family)